MNYGVPLNKLNRQKAQANIEKEIVIRKIVSVPYLCSVRERGFWAKKIYRNSDLERFECCNRTFAYSNKDEVLFVLPNPNNSSMPSLSEIKEKIRMRKSLKC